MWEIVTVGGGIVVILIATVILIAKRSGRKAEQIAQANRDRDFIKGIQEATNEPLPTDPDDVRDLLGRS